MALTVTRQGAICTTFLLGAVRCRVPRRLKKAGLEGGLRHRFGEQRAHALASVVERGHHGRRLAFVAALVGAYRRGFGSPPISTAAEWRSRRQFQSCRYTKVNRCLTVVLTALEAASASLRSSSPILLPRRETPTITCRRSKEAPAHRWLANAEADHGGAILARRALAPRLGAGAAAAEE
jgi:hypothetical protein